MSRSGRVAWTSGGVSERPRSGSRYPRPTSTETDPQSQWWQDFGQVPGGRKLWCRLVTVFTFVSLFGIGFIFLGAAFVHQAYRLYKEEQTSLPLSWCIVGIVSGSLMVLGSIVLGRFIISDKWRKNEQPNYPSSAPRPTATVRFTTNNNNADMEPEVHIDVPPPYEASNLPPIFIVAGRNVALTLPAPSSDLMMPPSYTDTIGSPPKYTEIDDVTPRNNQSSGDVDTGRLETASDCTVGIRPLSNASCSRIEVITVVSTREDPPPYEEGPSSLPVSTEAASSDRRSQVAPLTSVLSIENSR